VLDRDRSFFAELIALLLEAFPTTSLSVNHTEAHAGCAPHTGDV